MSANDRSTTLRYGGAVASAGFILALKLGIDPLFGRSATEALPLIAVVLAAWNGGVGPGLLATALAVLACQLRPLLASWDDWSRLPVEAVRMAIFIAEGAMLSALIEGPFAARRRTERALRRSESLRGAILESALDAIVAIDGGGRIVEFNPAASSAFGLTRAEAIGRPLADLLEPSPMREAIARGLSGGGRGEGPPIGRRVEVVAVRADGRRFPAELAIAEARCGDRAVFSAYLRDITERRRAEQGRRDSQAVYGSLVENLPYAIFCKDLSGRYTFGNRRFCALLGTTPEALVGKTDYDFHDDEAARKFRDDDRRVIEAAAPMEIEEGHRSGDGGEPRVIRTVKCPVLDDRGRPIGVQGAFEDITERRRAAEALSASEARYRLLYERSLAGVVRNTLDGRILDCNDAFARMLGLASRGEARSRSMAEFYDDPADRGATMALLQAQSYLAGYELRFRRPDGGVVHGLCDINLVREGGETIIQGTVVDISERKRMEEALRESEERHRLLFESCPYPMWVFDPETLDFLAVNGAAVQVYGYSREDFLEMTILDIRPPEDAEALLLWMAKQGDAETRSCWRHRKRDGAVIDVEVSSSGITFAGRRAMLTVAHDVTARRRAEHQLEHQASHDALTGLPNRAYLYRNLERSVAGEATSECDRFGLLLIDLDRFKEINDTFGHHYGDLVLQQLNPRLKGALRKTDFVARLGGDEFGVILPGADEAGAVHAAEKILEALAAPIVVDGHRLDVGASIGVALSPEHGRDAITLMQRADVAMYAAKRAHAGFAVASADRTEYTPQRLALIGELRRGIEDGQLLLHYQPKIDLATLAPCGAEALIRWFHPREGLLPPAQFIPLAEHTGLIRPMGLWALNTALLQCRVWHQAGLNLNVSVNLATGSLHDDQLDATIARLLESSDSLAPWLTVEITESAMMADPHRAREVLGRLHAMGVRVAIDDFGTGYSSLAYLKELPVDEVKVDRSFVKELATSDHDACIVQSVIDLGHNLGLRVVAEGVEDEATLELLRAMGCDQAQGYLFSRPLPPGDFSEWIAGRAAPAVVGRHAAGARRA